MNWRIEWLVDDPPSLDGGFGAWTHRERRVDEATVQVDFFRTGAGLDVVLKRYFFPRPAQRRRLILRHGWLLGRPRARREAEALDRMVRMGLPAAPALGWGVARDALGFVADSWLLSARLPGEDLARRMASGELLPDAAWFAVGESAGLLHSAGVLHRGLAARNVVLAEGADGWRAAWVDPAKAHFLSRVPEAWRAIELLGFWAGLPQATDWARAAFAEGYGDPQVARVEDLWVRIPVARRPAVERLLQKEARRRG